MCLSRNAGTLVAILLVFAGQARFSCGLTTLSPGPGTGPGTQLEMGAYLLSGGTTAPESPLRLPPRGQKPRLICRKQEKAPGPGAPRARSTQGHGIRHSRPAGAFV